VSDHDRAARGGLLGFFPLAVTLLALEEHFGFSKTSTHRKQYETNPYLYD
jgi:hypothetical protein